MKTDLQTAQVRALGSQGLAHRTAAGFVVLSSPEGAEMLAMIEANQTQPDLIDKIVAQHERRPLKAFAMLFTAGGDLYLMASGSAAIEIASTSTTMTMAAAADQVLVHAVNVGIHETGARIALRIQPAEPDGEPAHEIADFRSGTVHADALDVAVGSAQLSPVEATPPPVAATPAPATEVAAVDRGYVPGVGDTSAFTRSQAEPAAPAPISQPEPVEQPEAVATETSVGAPVIVLGIACPQGHHNHPEAGYCSQCGAKIGEHHTTVLINGPRPALGVLVVDDGSTYSIADDLVIGRDPASHPDVQAGLATPVLLADESLSLSRRHARIVLDEWSAYVEDLGSSNGTWVNHDRTAHEWTPVPGGDRVLLEPGDRLRVGGRIIQVELHH